MNREEKQMEQVKTEQTATRQGAGEQAIIKQTVTEQTAAGQTVTEQITAEQRIVILQDVILTMMEWYRRTARDLPWRERPGSLPRVDLRDHAAADEDRGGKAVL